MFALLHVILRHNLLDVSVLRHSIDELADVALRWRLGRRLLLQFVRPSINYALEHIVLFLCLGSLVFRFLDSFFCCLCPCSCFFILCLQFLDLLFLGHRLARSFGSHGGVDFATSGFAEGEVVGYLLLDDYPSLWGRSSRG